MHCIVDILSISKYAYSIDGICSFSGDYFMTMYRMQQLKDPAIIGKSVFFWIQHLYCATSKLVLGCRKPKIWPVAWGMSTGGLGPEDSG